MLFNTTYNYNTGKWGVESLSTGMLSTCLAYSIFEKSNHEFIVVSY